VSVDEGDVAADQPGQLNVLGFARAVNIVCTAANTDKRNLARTLSELGVEGVSFQGMVFNGIRRAGCTIDFDSIPDAPDTTLIAVAEAIQNAPAA
jgi:hypothetical protein